MRKNIFGFIIMIAVMLSGCGNTDSKVNQVIQDQMQEADNTEKLQQVAMLMLI